MGDTFRVLAAGLAVFLTLLTFDGDLELENKDKNEIEVIEKEETEENFTEEKPTDEETGKVEEEKNEEEVSEKEETEERERSDFEKSFIQSLILKAESHIGRIKTDKNGLSPFRGHFDAGQTEWSAEFIAFCIYETEEETGAKADFLPWCDTVNDCLLWFLSRNALIYDIGDETVLSGDFCFLDEDGDGKADRVAVVSGITATVDGVLLTLIEGNPLLPEGEPRVEKKIISVFDATFYAVGIIE